jgi:heme-degrading monooxygenase HmoA
MVAHTTTFQLKPAAADELIRRFQDAVAPAVARQSGFAGMLLLIEYNIGQVISIDLWETEADLLAGERSGYYQEQLSKDLLAGTPMREIYEVVIQVEMTEQGRAHIRGI